MDKTTAVSFHASPQSRICPSCGADNAPADWAMGGYRCGECGQALAHVDYAANGAVQGVYGWLLCPGARVLGHYRVRALLGKGGFGAAYLVDDEDLSGRRRALKEVPQALFDEHEARLLSRLDHPAIPDIVERRAVDGMVYMVLKFGGSRTLGGERARHPGQRIALAQLLPWMRQVCEVLDYLHRQTPPVIHRDLKPDNILLDEDGRVMLIDFGIAKEASPQALTRTLGRAATLGFSPPEQVMGAGTDERADIYALAATFYALLTGQSPAAAHERLAGQPLARPSSLVAGVPPDLDAAIVRALSLDALERPQTVRAFATALDAAPTRPSAVAAPPTRALGGPAQGGVTQPTAPRWPALALAGAVLAGAAGTAVYFVMSAQSPARAPELAQPTAPPNGPPAVAQPDAGPLPGLRQLRAIRRQRVADGTAVVPPPADTPTGQKLPGSGRAE